MSWTCNGDERTRNASVVVNVLDVYLGCTHFDLCQATGNHNWGGFMVFLSLSR